MTKPVSDWVALAVVTQPHGVSGRLKVKSFCEPAAGFAAYQLTDRQGHAVELKVTGEAQGLYIVAVEGLRDRNAAELWRGKELGVSSSALPRLDDRQFYIAELEGMAVTSPEGAVLGSVASVANYGAGDLIEIAFTNGQQEFYSFTDSNFPAIDRAARCVTFVAPELLGSREEEEGTA